MKSKSRTAMWKRLSEADRAKPLVKSMIFEGKTVVEIKQALKDLCIPVTAYNTLVNHGFVEKWRKKSKLKNSS